MSSKKSTAANAAPSRAKRTGDKKEPAAKKPASRDVKQLIEEATTADLDREIAKVEAYTKKQLAELKDIDALRKEILRDGHADIAMVSKRTAIDHDRVEELKAWNQKHADAFIARVCKLVSNPNPAAWRPYVRCVRRAALRTAVQCPTDLYANCVELLHDRLAAEITAVYPHVRVDICEDDDVLDDEVPEDMTQIEVTLITFDNSEWINH